MVITFDEEKLKDLLKSALAEALEEHRDLVQDIVEENVDVPPGTLNSILKQAGLK